MCKHPAYGQSLLKLGIHLSDPIVELGTVWARGDHASARLIHHAILSAEHLHQGRDKMLARVAGSIINKLKSYHSEAERAEGRRHKSPYAAGSLVGRRNPRARPTKRSMRAVPGWENPRVRPVKGGGFEGVAETNRGVMYGPPMQTRAAAKAAVLKKIARIGQDEHTFVYLNGPRFRNPRARPNENEIPTVIIKRAKRNPPISKSDAAAMCRVLRHHGYTCTKKGAKRSKARR